MQQNVSTKLVALVVVVFVAVIGFLGFKFVFKGNGSSGKAPAEAEKFLHPGSNTMRPSGGGNGGRPGMPGG